MISKHDQDITPRPEPPHYWMHEASGELAGAIVRYLENVPLSEQHITLIRLYCEQWILSEVWDQNPTATIKDRAELASLRRRALSLNSRESIDAWILDAVDLGMDPL